MDLKLSEKVQEGIPFVTAEIKDFNLKDTLESGQCFRWKIQKDGSYTGVVQNNILNVSADNDTFIFKYTDLETFRDLWYSYFDLGRDYHTIKQRLSDDLTMKKAIDFGAGIRILKQDIWETLISFIISANNNIPRIMSIIDNLSTQYGEELEQGFFAFPKPEVLANIDLNKLRECKAGFRCKYIKAAAEMVVDKKIDLYGLKNLSTAEAREQLQMIPGVGEKVADCVLLYSGTKYDIFPIDLWVKRAIEALYIGHEAKLSDVREFCKSKFMELEGFAQMYIFNYARLEKIGIAN